jgi:hypothetical protein
MVEAEQVVCLLEQEYLVQQILVEVVGAVAVPIQITVPGAAVVLVSSSFVI